jgi:TIR domain
MDRPAPSVFISYSHADKLFVCQLAADLMVLEIKVWVDEAELRVGDSLVSKISAAIDRVDFLAAVLSPHSVGSRWVQEELEQALERQIGGRRLTVLPLILQDCDIPGFLRTKLYADFRGEANYNSGLQAVLKALGHDPTPTRGLLIRDPLASAYNRIEAFYARPQVWYCIYCGARVERGKNYTHSHCGSCRRARPYMDADVTIRQCPRCLQLNVSGARFCEWCGAPSEKGVA